MIFLDGRGVKREPERADRSPERHASGVTDSSDPRPTDPRLGPLDGPQAQMRNVPRSESPGSSSGATILSAMRSETPIAAMARSRTARYAFSAKSGGGQRRRRLADPLVSAR